MKLRAKYDPFTMNKEIPVGNACGSCGFRSHTHYANEQDDLGWTDCCLFDDETTVWKLPECLLAFPYGGVIVAEANPKPKKKRSK